MIAIVNYGMGNLRSVQKAFEHIGAKAAIAHRPEEIDAADRIVLPRRGRVWRCHAQSENGGIDRSHCKSHRGGPPRFWEYVWACN